MVYRSSQIKIQNMVQILHPNTCFFYRNVTANRKYIPAETRITGRYGYSMQHQGLQLFSTNRPTWTTFGSNMVKLGKEDVKPRGSRNSSWHRFTFWARWLLGSILTVVHFSNEKLTKFRTIEGKAEMVVEEVENVVEIIEKTANVAEKVSSEVAEMLPEDGKLKQTALFVEHVSKQAVQDAHLTIQFIHKVDELKHDLEGLEAMIEPVVKMNHESEGK